MSGRENFSHIDINIVSKCSSIESEICCGLVGACNVAVITISQSVSLNLFSSDSLHTFRHTFNFVAASICWVS